MWQGPLIHDARLGAWQKSSHNGFCWGCGATASRRRIYSLIPPPIDPLSPSCPWPSSSFPLFVSVGILPPIVRKNRQKATKRTKDRKTGALGSLKNSVVRPVRCGSVGVVAAPHPHERVRECLLENAAVAVARGEAEYEAVVVALALSAAAVRSPAITQL